MIPQLPVNRNSVRFRMGHNGHSFRIRFRFRSRRRSTEHNQDFRSEVSTALDQPTGHPTVHAALSAPTGGTAYHRNLAVGRLPLPHAQSILAPVSSRGKVYRETERTSGRGGLHWNMEVYRLRARSTSWRRARRSHSLRQQTHNALEGPLPLLFPALRIPVSLACVPPDEGCTQ